MRLKGRFSLFAFVGMLILVVAMPAQAQLVRRFAGGGVQVNAPFVQVNVAPGGGVAVGRPYTALRVGGGILARRRLLRNQPPSPANGNPRMKLTPENPPEEKEPELADVDALPYPTAEQLQGMNDAELVETLREMMGRLNYRLSLFNTGDGWQEYLVLTRDDLGAPGSGPQTPKFETVQQVLPRFEGIRQDSQYVKIHTLPSFQAAHAALAEVDRRFDEIVPTEPAAEEVAQPAATPNGSGPELIPADEAESTATVVQAPRPRRVLPTRQPAAARGERSILKRK